MIHIKHNGHISWKLEKMPIEEEFVQARSSKDRLPLHDTQNLQLIKLKTLA